MAAAPCRLINNGNSWRGLDTGIGSVELISSVPPTPDNQSQPAENCGKKEDKIEMERVMPDQMDKNRLSLPKSSTSSGNELDYSLFLFEEKSNNGHGNAVLWRKDGANGNHEDERFDGVPEQHADAKQWKPLTRKENISALVISLYR